MVASFGYGITFCEYFSKSVNPSFMVPIKGQLFLNMYVNVFIPYFITIKNKNKLTNV